MFVCRYPLALSGFDFNFDAHPLAARTLSALRKLFCVRLFLVQWGEGGVASNGNSQSAHDVKSIFALGSFLRLASQHFQSNFNALEK